MSILNSHHPHPVPGHLAATGADTTPDTSPAVRADITPDTPAAMHGAVPGCVLSGAGEAR